MIRAAVKQIVDIVAAERELAFDGNLVAFVHHVAMNVRDVRNARDHARTVVVAQAAFDRIHVIEGRIDGINRYNIIIESTAFVFAHTRFLSTVKLYCSAKSESSVYRTQSNQTTGMAHV